jgi:hypothetical protein
MIDFKSLPKYNYTGSKWVPVGTAGARVLSRYLKYHVMSYFGTKEEFLREYRSALVDKEIDAPPLNGKLTTRFFIDDGEHIRGLLVVWFY